MYSHTRGCLTFRSVNAPNFTSKLIVIQAIPKVKLSAHRWIDLIDVLEASLLSKGDKRFGFHGQIEPSIKLLGIVAGADTGHELLRHRSVPLPEQTKNSFGLCFP